MRRGLPTPVLDYSSDRASYFTGNDLEVVLAAPWNRPPEVAVFDVSSSEQRALFQLPFNDTIFGNLESTPHRVTGPTKTGGMIVAFQGAFRGVRKMTYAAAYSTDGVMLWRIRDRLPPSSSAGITGDYGFLHLFGDGQFVAFRKKSEPELTYILNSENGREMGVIKGRVINAARNTNDLIIQFSPDRVALVRWSP